MDEVHGASADVLAAVDRAIPELVPPRSIDQAEALSHAGERLIPHLARITTFRTPNELQAVIRAAALIGGPAAFDLTVDIVRNNLDFIKNNISNNDRLASEFMRSWQYFDPDAYAEKVLASLNLSNLVVSGQKLFQELPKVPVI